jgi:hypothetical protein
MSVTAPQNEMNNIRQELLNKQFSIPMELVLPDDHNNYRFAIALKANIIAMGSDDMKIKFREITESKNRHGIVTAIYSHRQKHSLKTHSWYYETVFKSSRCSHEEDSDPNCRRCAKASFSFIPQRSRKREEIWNHPEKWGSDIKPLIKRLNIEVCYDNTNGTLRRKDHGFQCTKKSIEKFAKHYFAQDTHLSINILPLGGEQPVTSHPTPQPNAVSSAPQPASHSSSIPIKDLLCDDQEPAPASNSIQTASTKQLLNSSENSMHPKEPPAKRSNTNDTTIPPASNETDSDARTQRRY